MGVLNLKWDPLIVHFCEKKSLNAGPGRNNRVAELNHHTNESSQLFPPISFFVKIKINLSNKKYKKYKN